MSTTITVKPNQSMTDVIIMGCGSLEGAAQFCRDNNVAVSDMPVVGTPYLISDACIVAAGSTGAAVQKYLNQNGYIIGTLAYTPPPPLSMQVVLMPVIKAVPGTTSHPSVTHNYQFSVNGDTGFISVYGLVPGVGGYPSEPNVVHYITTDIVGGSPAITNELTPTDMTTQSIPYKIPWTAGHSYMMVFGAIDPTSLLTFEDVNGNQAHCHPVIILDSSSQTVEDFLIPSLDVTLVSGVPGGVVVRLTRSHYTPGLSGLTVHDLNWTDAATGGPGITGLGPDPADPTNTNKLCCTLAAGTYTFGVLATYTYTGGSIASSGMQCVVEVS